MDDLLKLASQLGAAISKSEPFRALRAAEKAVEEDPEAKGLLDRFSEQSEALRGKERSGARVGAEERHAFADLQRRAQANPRLQKLVRAQTDFADLMRRTNEQIQIGIGQ